MRRRRRREDDADDVVVVVVAVAFLLSDSFSFPSMRSACGNSPRPALPTLIKTATKWPKQNAAPSEKTRDGGVGHT